MLCSETWTILMMESIYCHDTGEGLVFPKVNTKERRIVLLRCHPRPFANFSIKKSSHILTTDRGSIYIFSSLNGILKSPNWT